MRRTRVRWFVSLLVVLILMGCSSSESEKFKDSLVSSIRANEISVALPKLEKSAPRQVKPKEKEMIEYIEKSLSAADSVSEDYLRTLHPKLPKYYRDYLMEGQRLYMEGVKEGNPLKQI